MPNKCNKNHIHLNVFIPHKTAINILLSLNIPHTKLLQILCLGRLQNTKYSDQLFGIMNYELYGFLLCSQKHKSETL